MPFNQEETLKEILKGQATLAENQKNQAKLQSDLAIEISIIKNSQQAFVHKQDVFNTMVKSHMFSDPNTHQKGMVEQLSTNTQDISRLKLDMKALWRSLDKILEDVKVLLKDVNVLNTQWKVKAGQGGIVIAMGIALWQLAKFALSFIK